MSVGPSLTAKLKAKRVDTPKENCDRTPRANVLLGLNRRPVNKAETACCYKNQAARLSDRRRNERTKTNFRGVRDI